MLWIRSVVVQVSSASAQGCSATFSKTASSPRPSHLSQSGLPSTSSAIRWNSGANRWSKNSPAHSKSYPAKEVPQLHSSLCCLPSSPQPTSSNFVPAKVSPSKVHPSAWSSTAGATTTVLRKLRKQHGERSNAAICKSVGKRSHFYIFTHLFVFIKCLSLPISA